MDSVDAEPPSASFAAEIFFLGPKIVGDDKANYGFKRRQIERLRRFMRVELNGTDSNTTVAIDQHSIATA